MTLIVEYPHRSLARRSLDAFLRGPSSSPQARVKKLVPWEIGDERGKRGNSMDFICLIIR